MHDRMPVILRDEAFDAWLDPARDDPTPIMTQFAREDFECIAVGAELNQRGAHGERLITPLD